MLKISKFSKFYDDKCIFKNFSFKCSKNQIVGIYGRSGKGKSTLLKCIFNHENYIDNISLESYNIGILPQEDTYCDWLDVYSNITLPLNLSGIKITPDVDKKILSLAKKFGIKDILSKSVSEISGGEKQRVILIRLLIRDFDIYLIDEPFSSLDKKTYLKIFLHMKSFFKNNNKTAIFVLHNDDLEKYFDKVLKL